MAAPGGGVAQAGPPPPDALSLLSAALSAPSPAAEDAALEQLYEVLHAAPGNIPPLFSSLIGLIPRAGPSMTTWVLRVCSLVFCRPSLNTQTKLQRECRGQRAQAGQRLCIAGMDMERESWRSNLCAASQVGPVSGCTLLRLDSPVVVAIPRFRAHC
jgi:hypothetical protein